MEIVKQLCNNKTLHTVSKESVIELKKEMVRFAFVTYTWNSNHFITPFQKAGFQIQKLEGNGDNSKKYQCFVCPEYGLRFSSEKKEQLRRHYMHHFEVSSF